MKLKFAACLAAFLWAGPAIACETYVAVDTAQAKELLKVMADAAADPLDKLAAFETLACSDKPAIRDHALRNGLGLSTDDLTRGQILAEILYSKGRFKLALDKKGVSDKGALDFINSASGSILYPNRYIDRTRGCISLQDDGACRQREYLVLRGTSIEFDFSNQALTGTFALGDDNRLLGSVKYQGSVEIPAEIILFE